MYQSMQNMGCGFIATVGMAASMGFQMQTHAAGMQSSGYDTSKPNIVLILADDMGYGDIAALNERSKIPTPNLDQIANDGMTFTDAHTPSSVCTPTRYGLLTGRYCWRTRLKRGVLNGYSRPLIERERRTIGTLLQQQGYHTAIIGKWHLGLEFVDESGDLTDPDERMPSVDLSKPLKYSPNDVGFDESYIISASLDFPPYVYIKNHRVEEVATEEHEAIKFPAYMRAGEKAPGFKAVDTLDHMTSRAVDYIDTQAKTDEPFFLYFPITAPHKPVLPHDRFVDQSSMGRYGDFVMQVDWTVGQIIQKLKDEGIEESTLVIYTSDNGSFMYRYDKETRPSDHRANLKSMGYYPENHEANYNFRGTKADIFEAGHRVPFLVKWPAKIASGSKVNQTVCLTDIFSTFAEIAGVPINRGEGEDSFSLLSVMQGDQKWVRKQPVVHHSSRGAFAIRDGDWKLILTDGSGGRQRPQSTPFAKPYQLYNLKNDIGERQDLAREQSEIRDRLEEKCLKIIASDASRYDIGK
ncbi:sulfatase family protein [Poriferisphaera sp. WC338]|uniref:sulfatase family protein n=1 Tax=Poriferisphaera sp. WC338 TaxID=3425129 RepID=UPI003D81C151